MIPLILNTIMLQLLNQTHTKRDIHVIEFLILHRRYYGNVALRDKLNLKIL